MKKITILALHLNYGGIEKCISSLVNMLHNDFEIEIISFYKMSNKPPFSIPTNVKVSYLLEDKPNRDTFLQALKEKRIFKVIQEGIKSIKILYLKKSLIKKTIAECESDIIISTRSEFSLFLASSKRNDIIKIAHEHEYHNNNTKYISNIGKIIEGVNYFLPSSQYLTDFYKEEFPQYCDKVKYLKWPVELANSSENKLVSKNIVTTGRLSSEKGYSDLLDIFSVLHKMHPDWTLTIIGDGVLNSKLREKAVRLELSNYVNFTGFLDQKSINEIYLNSSIYVMTSTFESFGLVLLEAGIMHLPLVAYSSALGAREILDNNNYGILVENRSKNEMIKRINNLIEDKVKRVECGNKAYERASSYLFDVVKEEHLDFYKNLKGRE